MGGHSARRDRYVRQPHDDEHVMLSKGGKRMTTVSRVVADVVSFKT